MTSLTVMTCVRARAATEANSGRSSRPNCTTCGVKKQSVDGALDTLVCNVYASVWESCCTCVTMQARKTMAAPAFEQTHSTHTLASSCLISQSSMCSNGAAAARSTAAGSSSCCLSQRPLPPIGCRVGIMSRHACCRCSSSWISVATACAACDATLERQRAAGA